MPIAGAQGAGANNLVIVQTSTDGSALSRAGVQVAPYGGSTVASANIAEATASDCTGCSSAAVAIQAVFVTGDPSVVTPGNAAVATNAACADCTSYAYAYQYVLSTNGPVYVSTEGRAELDVLRSEFAATAAADMSPADKTAALDVLTGQFKALVDNQLLAAGQAARGIVYEQVREG
jgi:hypothetical protein